MASSGEDARGVHHLMSPARKKPSLIRVTATWNRERFRASLADSGLSQEEAAGAVGVPTRTVQTYLNGEVKSPGGPTVAALARLLGVPPESWFDIRVERR